VTNPYVLDAFPVLCWLQEEPGHQILENLLSEAEEGKCTLWMNIVNLGEVFYRICKVVSLTKAEQTVAKIRILPISIVSASDEMVMEAARIKGKHPISYADAFAVATALGVGAPVVTGDPEYRSVEKVVKILWVR
jgi:predicted nucleic acid-binding protein